MVGRSLLDLTARAVRFEKWAKIAKLVLARS
jgi:hypothetical protein